MVFALAKSNFSNAGNNSEYANRFVDTRTFGIR